MTHPANQSVDDFIGRGAVEDVLEPDLAIIDAHHHLWDIRGLSTEPYHSFQQKLYLCEEITADINHSGHNIEQTVFAQCGAFFRADGPKQFRPVGETEFVHGVAAMSRSGRYGDTRLCTGIFGTADLRLGAAVEEVIESHIAASANFRGIRSAFPSDLNETFMAGVAVLEKHGLSFDNWSPDYERLPTLAKLALENPGVTVIVNHLGGQIDVEAGDSGFKRWHQCIKTVAACPNAVMKLGGAQMRIDGWEPSFHMNQRDMALSSETFCELLYPYYLAAIEAFGPDRCMFESNFPVDRECVSYRTLWNVFKRIAAKAGMSASEKGDLFKGTAARAYRLST
ncbi:MAG: L-fuconolactonase [Candidatus Azotimanducaceae bacterium]|jgi:L-fuconolactonase